MAGGDVVFNDAAITVEVGGITIHYHGISQAISDRLASIDANVQQVREGIQTMQPELQRLTDEVAETRTAQQGLITLVAGLAQQIRDNASDPVALKALADSLDAGQTEIADAVAANTPGAPT